MPKNALFSYRTAQTRKELSDPNSPAWKKQGGVSICRNWDGSRAHQGGGRSWANLTSVRSCWNNESVFFLFLAKFDHLNVNSKWSTVVATETLYEKDVVEVFFKLGGRKDYFEINVSPLGQWLSAHILEPRASVDFHWNPRLALRTKCNRQQKTWRVFLGIPYASIPAPCPEVGQFWRLNLFRMAGSEAKREYLAWRPTFTAKPDFHVPASFGHLVFLDGRFLW